METQLEKNEVASTPATFVKMAVDAWQSQNHRVTELVNGLADEHLKNETAPSRNSGTYLLGHLTAVNDALLPLLGFGEKMYPEMEEVFLRNSDNAGLEHPPVAELKNRWNTINAKLTEHINKMQPEDWFTKHATISAEDFAKEPHRNKLNVLIGRATHQSYHLGQMNYLKKK